MAGDRDSAEPLDELMAWFKVDDGFWSHPKTAGLSDGATALWLRAGSWSAGHLTDGFVPDSALRFFRARRRSAAELVAVGLWSAVDGGFVFHDWGDYQPSKAQVTAKREATKTRVNAWRERVGNGVTDSGGGEVGNAAPVPTRPDPSRPVPVKREGTAARGTRIPEPFELTEEMRQWAAEEVPLVDVDRSTRMFVDYWRAATGAKATKRDWLATWRNWLRRDQERRVETAGRGTPTERARAVIALGVEQKAVGA